MQISPPTMPRFLTASKLALLLLADIYITADLSPTARQKILHFLATRILVSSNSDTSSLNSRYELASSSDIAAIADTLAPLPANVPGRSLYDVLLARAWALDGLDAIVEFVKRVAESVGTLRPPKSDDADAPSSPKISKSSPFGQFIRRSNVEITRLQFADAQALWTSFSAFRASSYTAWATRNPA
jgi:anaphase-promoting complex subunit 5